VTYDVKAKSMKDDGVYCAGCGFQFEEGENNHERKPCPQCNSTKRVINASIHAEIKVYDSLRGQAKSPNYTGKKKMRWDSFVGWVKSHSLGKMVKKSRTIDKDKNLYQETIIDPDIKEVIHHCEEPLDKHIGHGSAKSKMP
jgi:hypothetical protein